MLLRASGEHNGQAIDLDAVIGAADGDGGIPGGDLLVAFAEAVVGEDAQALADARQAVLDTLGERALVDSCGVAATFNAIEPGSGCDRHPDRRGAGRNRAPVSATGSASTASPRGCRVSPVRRWRWGRPVRISSCARRAPI